MVQGCNDAGSTFLSSSILLHLTTLVCGTDIMGALCGGAGQNISADLHTHVRTCRLSKDAISHLGA